MKQLRHLQKLKKVQADEEEGRLKLSSVVSKMSLALSGPMIDDVDNCMDEIDIDERIRKVQLSLEKLHVQYEHDLEIKVLEETGIVQR